MFENGFFDWGCWKRFTGKVGGDKLKWPGIKPLEEYYRGVILRKFQRG